MYNLNVNLATTAAAAGSFLGVDTGCTTPRTPEILNSLIAMTNPLDNYNFGDDAPKTAAGPPTSLSSCGGDSNSSTSSSTNSTETSVCAPPPSIQHTCSQLIKAGLKLSIEQKRKLQQGESEDLLDLDKCKRFKRSECSESEEDKNNYGTGLTPEDEERRRRRRERNKIAATKCRLKKRERTANLVTESETLETQNIEFKAQIQELKNQQRQLLEILTLHRPNCTKNIPPATRDAIFSNRLPPVSVIETNHTYGSSYGGGFKRESFLEAPSIVVDGPSDSYQPHLTNLDDPVLSSAVYHYNNQCHNYTATNQAYGNSPGLDNGCMA